MPRAINGHIFVNGQLAVEQDSVITIKGDCAARADVRKRLAQGTNVRGNAGSFTNGMPQTASLGCGTWGGNITSENISVKHYMNTTWVSRPIAEDRPTEQELLGEFYNSEVF